MRVLFHPVPDTVFQIFCISLSDFFKPKHIGFEHSIANAFLLPYALLIKAGAGADFWSLLSQSPAQYAALNAVAAARNVLIATVGNLLGGSLLVGGIYWLVYLRKSAVTTPGPR